jgi:hypothetical protein
MSKRAGLVVGALLACALAPLACGGTALPRNDSCPSCPPGSTTGAAGSTTGSAGATGAAGATGFGGATGAGGAHAQVMAFCLQLSMIDCDRAYECVPPAMRDADFVTAESTNIPDCKGALTQQSCVGFGDACNTFNQAAAESCLSTYATETCDQIFADMGPPVDCYRTCGQ